MAAVWMPRGAADAACAKGKMQDSPRREKVWGSYSRRSGSLENCIYCRRIELKRWLDMYVLPGWSAEEERWKMNEGSPPREAEMVTDFSRIVPHSRGYVGRNCIFAVPPLVP
jgi:hypothetical protein